MRAPRGICVAIERVDGGDDGSGRDRRPGDAIHGVTVMPAETEYPVGPPRIDDVADTGRFVVTDCTHAGDSVARIDGDQQLDDAAVSSRRYGTNVV
jgi:hypothetical protein